MNRGLRIVVAVPAVVFLVVGAGWWVLPSAMARQFGMTLQGPVGLSTQVGDLGSFFLTLGGSMIAALITDNRVWFYPALMLVGLAAIGRVVAWLVHDAAFAYDMLAVEVPMIALLLFIVRKRTAEQA